MLYLTTVFLAILLFGSANLLFNPTFAQGDPWIPFLLLMIGAAYAFSIDGISALLIRRLTPEKWYEPDRVLFTVSKAERNLYNKLKIKAWKDKVPEWGGFTSFHKDRLASSSDQAYLRRFLIEANYGVVIHIANGVLGILVLLLPPCRYPSVAIPVFAVNLILSLLPVAILRHTSYTLLRLYHRTQRNQHEQ